MQTGQDTKEHKTLAATVSFVVKLFTSKVKAVIAEPDNTIDIL